ncbi:coiled-coil domain-containing protein 25-like [Diadema antillarum]|uniref:coiled-coil domain-containing protein 25-like n=1 Tax=Diadema antillarum TaxID=105358 RepID=UPI003A8646A4
MVFYFTSNVVSPPYTIYVGEDKYENEELIKYGFPEDVWFHVDKLSSAHVYLRLKKGQTMDDIPGSVLEDCAQLVKANSIQGSKMNDIAVVYTPWENLKKTGDMAVGQVGFKKAKEVRTVKVAKKINEIVNRLNKTKKELKPDLRLEKEARDREEREEAKKELKEKRKQEEEMLKQKKEQAELRSYKSLMREENMTSNANNTEEDLEDDFM